MYHLLVNDNFFCLCFCKFIPSKTLIKFTLETHFKLKFTCSVPHYLFSICIMVTNVLEPKCWIQLNIIFISPHLKLYFRKTLEKYHTLFTIYWRSTELFQKVWSNRNFLVTNLTCKLKTDNCRLALVYSLKISSSWISQHRKPWA